MRSGWCIVCGGGSPREVSVTASAEDRTPARFVSCGRCGHVYRDPMPDQAELLGVGLAGTRSRTSATKAVHSRAGELAAWLEDGHDRSGPRSLLAVGEGRDDCRLADVLQAFRAHGWSVDALPAGSPTLRHAGSGRASAPSRRFDLVLCLDVVERLDDPVPFLRSLKRQLRHEGRIMVLGANLLDPPMPHRLSSDLFAGHRARIYSPETLRTILARAGYRTERAWAYRGDRRIGCLAGPLSGETGETGETDGMIETGLDDPSAIHELFTVLQWPGSSHILGWNLAALAETQPWVLPALCRRQALDAFTIRRSGRAHLAIETDAPDGHALPIVRWGDLDGQATRRAEGVDVDGGPADATVVQLGLGSGELASWLAERLSYRQHLIVWEADSALARQVLSMEDLSPLWLSTQVSLVVGEQPDVPPALAERLESPAIVCSTASARLWNQPAYRRILSRLTPVPI